ncbi:MAG TPA: hypothetical protein DCY27_07690 [Desulfobacterales bacterium]|nr:hypothetical protein [Desulfobacterales bacterium]
MEVKIGQGGSNFWGPAWASRLLNAEAMLLAAGFVLCLAAALGMTGALCLTRGCELYQDFAVLGLSMHVWGAVAFGGALVVKLLDLQVYRRLILACLWGEVVLLAWQVLSAPCSECLLVGLIWGATAWLAVRAPVSQGVWAGLWATSLVVILLESAAPWPMYGRPEAPMKIFFSPGCEACQAELAKLAEAGPAVLANVALYPIARNDGEVAAVRRMAGVLQQTGNLWLALLQGSPRQGEATWLSDVSLRLRLWSNKLLLARMGVTRVPVALSYSLDASGNDCGVSGGQDCM